MLQVTSNEVSARVAQAEATEREIDDTREQYRPVASHASLLFFAISELAAIGHDKLYADKWPREWSDAIFYALLANTVSDLDAYLMWAAVRVGGAAFYAEKIPQPNPETERQAP